MGGADTPVRRLDARPALALDSAKALNEAYAQEDPIKDLMRTHRVLALSRGAAGRRLAVLRKIAVLDANNSIWLEDVPSFEKSRRRSSRGNQPRLYPGRHRTSVRSRRSWPRRLDRQAAGSHEQRRQSGLESTRRCHRRSALTPLTAALVEAHARQNAADGRSLRNRWNQKAKEASLTRNDNLWATAAPAP